MTLSPRLEKKYTSERSSNSFPGTTCMSGCLENCQKSIPKSWCSPIQGTISDFLLNYGTDFPLVFTHFRTLSPGLENIGTLECIYASFPGTLSYLSFLENSWNSTPLCSSSSILGTMSCLVLKFHVARIWECNLSIIKKKNCWSTVFCEGIKHKLFAN